MIVSGTTLYGMSFGGAYAFGNIFSVGIDGSNFESLLSFTGTGGAVIGSLPVGGLMADGATLYGVTEYGGVNGYGSIFSVGMDGTNYQNLVSYTGSGGMANGCLPAEGLVIGGTTLYGTTRQYPYGAGNIFSVGTDGTSYENLVSFTGSGGTAAGSLPECGLIISGGRLYGMTLWGGSKSDGNVFSVSLNGTNYQNVLSFTGTGGAASGQEAGGSLICSGTTLYGTTIEGGANGLGNIFSVGIDGTNYENLLSFTGTGGAADGQYPGGSLILSGTTLYGVTGSGGADGYGNIFSVGIDGSDYQDRYDFTDGADGAIPEAGLTISGGTLFGTTDYAVQPRV